MPPAAELPAPLFKIKRSPTVLPTIVIQVQVIWLRLLGNSKAFDFPSIKSTVLNEGGIVSWLRQCPPDLLRKSVESILYYWRRMVVRAATHDPVIDDLLNTEGLFLAALGGLVSIEKQSLHVQAYKNVFTYVSINGVNVSHLVDCLPSWSQLTSPDQILVKLGDISMEGLIRLSKLAWPNPGMNVIITLEYYLRSEGAIDDDPWTKYAHSADTLEINSSIELWFSQHFGVLLSKLPSPSPNLLAAFIRIFNRIECVRHPQMLKLMDLVFRLSFKSSHLSSGDYLTEFITRFHQFSCFLNDEQRFKDSIITVAKYQMGKDAPSPSFFDCVRFCISIYQNDIDLLDLASSFAAKYPQVLSLSSHGCDRLLFKRICSKSPVTAASMTESLNTDYGSASIAFDFLFESCDSRSAKKLLETLTNANEVIRILPSFVTLMLSLYLLSRKPFPEGLQEKLYLFENKMASTELLIQLLDPVGERIPPVFSNFRNIKASYLKEKSNYEGLLLAIKDPSGIKQMCTLYLELMESIYCLAQICQLSGSYRLFKYYVKAGCHYSDYLMLTSWKETFCRIEIENAPIVSDIGERKILPADCSPNTKTIKALLPIVNRVCPPFDAFAFESMPDCRMQINRLLLECEDAITAVSLITELRLVESLMDLEAHDDKDLAIEEEANQELASPATITFHVDNQRNLLYLIFKRHPLVGYKPIGLRLRLSPPLQDILGQLESLYERNKKNLFDIPSTTERSDPHFKRRWWDTRYTLENDLKALLEDLCNGWFGEGTYFDLLLKSLRPIEKRLHPDTVAPTNGIDVDNILSCLSVLGEHRGLLAGFLEFLGFSKLDAASTIKKVRFAPIIDSPNPFDDTSEQGETELPPIIIELDDFTHDVPWESLKVFKGYTILRGWCSVNALRPVQGRGLQSICALLNPGGDLKRTEEEIGRLLRSVPSVNPLFAGGAPSSEKLREALSSSDLFLYFGHGSGETYLPRSELVKLNGGCSPAFLFGCSSGRLKQYGPGFRREGTLLSYLRAGSSLILSNLWDVTDKDIDKFTEAYLKAIGLLDSKIELDPVVCGAALQRSRSVCLLPLLNGAAPIIYINKTI